MVAVPAASCAFARRGALGFAALAGSAADAAVTRAASSDPIRPDVPAAVSPSAPALGGLLPGLSSSGRASSGNWKQWNSPGRCSTAASMRADGGSSGARKELEAPRAVGGSRPFCSACRSAGGHCACSARDRTRWTATIELNLLSSGSGTDSSSRSESDRATSASAGRRPWQPCSNSSMRSSTPSVISTSVSAWWAAPSTTTPQTSARVSSRLSPGRSP